MILYLYAVVDGFDDAAGLTGVAGEPLVTLRLHTHLIVGGWVEAAPAVGRDSLAAQDALVRHLHDRAAALLPMRFGSSFPTTADAERAIKTMGPGLDEGLARARGREQMTIRVLADAGAGGAEGVVDVGGTGGAGGMGAAGAGAQGAGAGARYLAARAARATPPEIAPLLEALKCIQRATRVEAGRRSGVVATIYQLIDRGAADNYRQAAERAAADLPAVSMRITGPSPCYAFT